MINNLVSNKGFSYLRAWKNCICVCWRDGGEFTSDSTSNTLTFADDRLEEWTAKGLEWEKLDC